MAQTPKRPRDPNQLAKFIVDTVTADGPPSPKVAASPGRPGGLRGGPARAAKLEPTKRSEIARRAARARWSKDDNSN